MLSKEVLRVKHAQHMGLMESVEHFTRVLSNKRKASCGRTVKPIAKAQRDNLLDYAQRSLAWARDRARPRVPGAAQMTNDQVRRRPKP